MLADSGYASEENFGRAHAGGLRLLAPLAKDPGRRRIRTPNGLGTWTGRAGFTLLRHRILLG